MGWCFLCCALLLTGLQKDDWKRPGPNVVAQRLIDGARPGAILLAHDIQPGSIEAAPIFLDKLLSQGYKFVTVSVSFWLCSRVFFC